MAAIAAKIDLTVQAGATWAGDAFKLSDKATGTPVDLTGYEARMQIRASMTDTTVTLDLTTVNGKLQLTPLLGRIDILVDSEATSALAPEFVQKTYVYGIELYKPLEGGGETVIALAQGKVTVEPEVVRPAP